MSVRIISPIAAATFVVVACACASNRAPEPVSTSRLTSASLDVATRLAEATCDRRGGNCGAFATYDDCVRVTTPDIAARARLQNCTGFIASPRVSDCAAELRTSACGTALSSLPSCQHEKMCPPRAEEGTL